MRRALLTLAAIVVGLVALPAPASAATSPYGHFAITYRNKSTYVWQVKEAVAVWNRAGTPYRLVPAKAGAKADITITQKPYIGSPSSAVAGYGGHGFVWLSVKRLRLARTYNYTQVRVAAHELGHALGLPHSSNACALMLDGTRPISKPCAIVETPWDGRAPCGPRTVDVAALGRMYKFAPKPVAWRGYCTVPTNAAAAATAPVVAFTLTGEPTQGLGATLTLTNTGNVIHELGAIGTVLVDANGVPLSRPFRFSTEPFSAARTIPGPGASTELTLPPCTAPSYPALMRVRVASTTFDAFLSPELQVRIDPDGDPSVPASECTNAEAITP